jgi:hypothetical protein
MFLHYARRQPDVTNLSTLKYNLILFTSLIVQTVNALRAKDTSCRYVFTDIYALQLAEQKKVIAQRALTSVKMAA